MLKKRAISLQAMDFQRDIICWMFLHYFIWKEHSENKDTLFKNTMNMIAITKPLYVSEQTVKITIYWLLLTRTQQYNRLRWSFLFQECNKKLVLLTKIHCSFNYSYPVEIQYDRTEAFSLITSPKRSGNRSPLAL